VHLNTAREFRVFSWAVVYQGLCLKAKPVKSSFTDAHCSQCGITEIVQHICRQCEYAKYCQDLIWTSWNHIICTYFLWKDNLLGNFDAAGPPYLGGVWHCIIIVYLYFIWRLRCRSFQWFTVFFRIF